MLGIEICYHIIHAESVQGFLILIDSFNGVYAASAMFQLFITVATFIFSFEVLKFSWCPSRAFSSLKYRKTVFCKRRGLISWHRTQVNVSSDGHIDILEISNLTKLLKNILKSKTFILCWKNRIRIYINCKTIETLISNNVYYVRIERIKIIHVFTWLLILSFFP